MLRRRQPRNTGLFIICVTAVLLFGTPQLRAAADAVPSDVKPEEAKQGESRQAEDKTGEAKQGESKKAEDKKGEAKQDEDKKAEDKKEEDKKASKLLLGDLGGLRPALGAHGIELGITYTGEAFGSLTGGVRRGAVHDGQLLASLDADLDKLAGWSGAKAHVDMLEIHGRGPSASLLDGNLMTVSNIEARPALRLYTLWLEQNLLDDKLSLRLGQIRADEEFITSTTAAGLINSTFGWPAIAASDTTEGGPVYPLAQPGVRLQLKPAPDLTLRSAVFSSNPGGRGCLGDPQICNRSGTTFSLSGGTFAIAELEYAANAGKDAKGLPGTYKLGAWRETGTFTDQFTGLRTRNGDWAIYGIADQTVWQPKDSDEALTIFMRMAGAPSDRNLVTWYADGGFGLKAPLPKRPDDVLTLAFAYGKISEDAAAADRLAGPPTPVRDHEAVIELDYNLAVRPGWTLQPDLQYVIHPGGNVLNPKGSRPIGDALLLGLRTTLTF
jgi:porin